MKAAPPWTQPLSSSLLCTQSPANAGGEPPRAPDLWGSSSLAGSFPHRGAQPADANNDFDGEGFEEKT